MEIRRTICTSLDQSLAIDIKTGRTAPAAGTFFGALHGVEAPDTPAPDQYIVRGNRPGAFGNNDLSFCATIDEAINDMTARIDTMERIENGK